MEQEKGFTLVEIMIVVALIAILAAVAIPAYGNYVIRGKLVEASAQLADMRIKFEQSFQDNRNYTNFVDADCKLLAGTKAGQLAVGTSKYFSYTCDTTATTYLVTAKSKANQGLGVAEDYQYTIDQDNNKATLKFAGQDSTSTCWLMKKGDSC